jgi:hypothetical protein
MAVSTPQALPKVRLINASQDHVSAEMRDDAGRMVLVEAEPGEVIEVPGEWCVEPMLMSGKRRMSAIAMMIPQLKPAPAAAAHKDANAATAAAFERALKDDPAPAKK